MDSADSKRKGEIDMAVCKKCGSEIASNAKFCEFCGTKVEQDVQREPYETSQTVYQMPPANISPRNIVLAVILSIVTCGVYGIYWMIKINDEINELAGEPNATSGGLVFLFNLITCGIYGLFWMYKMGERCDVIKGNKASSGILYLILALFGFGIISYCLMQDTVNKAVS